MDILALFVEHAESQPELQITEGSKELYAGRRILPARRHAFDEIGELITLIDRLDEYLFLRSSGLHTDAKWA